MADLFNKPVDKSDDTPHIEESPDIEAAREQVDEASDLNTGYVEDEPDGFKEGFTIKSILGALFVALIMMPGAIYLGLVAGQGLGAAAQWVTIVLFAEVARRSFLPLSRQEIYLLYYIAGGLAYVALGDRGISGGPMGVLIWNQYFVQSPQAANIAREIPDWVTPQPEAVGIIQRTFFQGAWFHPDWAKPIGVLILTQILERVSWIPAGYILFRATSDVERLPFPLASVAASGATALAEASSKEESWRWRVFSTGTTIGLIFGAFYIAIPVLTGTIFGTAVTLIPIPFADFMKSTETFMPAAPVNLSGDLGKVLIGFVLPFSMVVGTTISSVVCQWFGNPVLYNMGLLPKWHPGMESINTRIATNFDFWMSAGIGIQIAIALIGLYIIIKATIDAARGKAGDRGAWDVVPKGRGDTPATVKWAALVWFGATIAYIATSHWLLPTFPLWLLVVYGLVWTPINSFIAARMFGLTSQGVNFPFLKELTIMRSGYQGVDVWFAPLPLHDYGHLAQSFREIELTKTKFTSVIKAELLMFPLIIIGGLLYWQFIWHTSPIPSAQYPFAQRLWPITATNQAIFNQINKPDGATFVLDALKPPIIAGGTVAALVLYGVMFAAKAPLLAFYGAAGGANAFPGDTLPMLFGGLLSKFYFEKKIGTHKWRDYAPVLLAGFSCGTGLISMGAIALALIAKAVQPLPF
ncbi:MAG: peptide transporter [Armatimonadetes bacterium]|nr:peptide transporter [Armatimonadota bacterium]